MPTRTTYIIIVALAVVMLFAVDRLGVQEFSRQQRKSLARVSFDLVTHFRNFFKARLNAVDAACRLVGNSPHETGGREFSAVAETLFSAIHGVESLSLLDENLDVLSSWPEHLDTAESPSIVSHRQIPTELARKARDKGTAVASCGLALADGDFSLVIVQPVRSMGSGPPLLIAGEFRIWQDARRAFNTGSPKGYFAFLEDPSGQILLQQKLLPYDGPERKAIFRVADKSWAVHVRPPPGSLSSLLGARLALYGLGIVVLLSFLLVYYLLAEKSAELAENCRVLAVQTRTTREANRELVRANKELDDFAYVVAHDLKEPLRGVEGLTKLLLEEYREKLDNTAVEYLSFVRASGGRMRRLVNDLLHLSRVTRRQYPRHEVDFSELVQEVLDTLRFSLARKKATLKVQPDMPTVPCDRVRVSELFQNLLSNAVKFSNGRQPEIEIGHEEHAEEHLFWVRDNGPGIASEDQDRVFEIFQKSHDDNNGSGTGVGLTICKRIVERHGGKIWVESVPNRGSSFYFTLQKAPPGRQAPSDRAGQGDEDD